MTVRGKLIVAGLVALGAIAYIAYLGAASSWQYYVTVDECLAEADRLAGQRIRVGGRIAAGTLRIAGNRRAADFALEGAAGRLPVVYAGPLPDRLAEGLDAVVEGRLDDAGTVRAEKLLTRCASKYQSQPSESATGNSPLLTEIRTGTLPEVDTGTVRGQLLDAAEAGP